MARPYCSFHDIQRELPQRTFDSSHDMTPDRVKEFMWEIEAEITQNLREAGYTVPVSVATSTTLNGSVSAVATTAVLDSVTGFSVGDSVRFRTLASTTLLDEFVRIAKIATLTITFEPALTNTYADADAVDLIIPGLMRLRRLNIAGAAGRIEGSTFFGGNPGESEQGNFLLEEYEAGLGAILTRGEYLYDLTFGDEVVEWPQSSGLQGTARAHPPTVTETEEEISAGVEPTVVMSKKL